MEVMDHSLPDVPTKPVLMLRCLALIELVAHVYILYIILFPFSSTQKSFGNISNTVADISQVAKMVLKHYTS